MVIVELKGGLGNQFFQYAAGIALSQYYGVPLKVNIANLQAPDKTLGTSRQYMLSNLSSPPETVIYTETNGFLQRLLRKINSVVNPSAPNIYKEKNFYYDTNFWKTGKSVHIIGNFQSELYFSQFKKKILSKIKINELLLSVSDIAMLKAVTETESLSIHIRRGDYVSNKIANNVLGVLPLTYYQAAYKLITEAKNIKHTFVFSDDIEWVKNNFTFITNVTFVDNSGENKDIADFYLMQHCSHNIIANSSFSWWAAYLNPNPDKMVVAPQRWFNKANLNTKDLLPAGWIKV
jgi:hypothetical protein